ncbi:MAG: hypothetical protein JSV07_04825 [Acidimicrobiia bacterium]|nr:MAG: hypothetical protein JSV07_04825 [Acidimicrobiia bacterium]
MRRSSSARLRSPSRWLRGKFADDSGFGIMEAVVSLVIIFGLIVILLRTFDSSSRVLVESRRQAAATALGLELVERAQALEWANMGLAVSTNGATCPDDVGCYTTEFPSLAATTDGWEWGSPAEDIVFATGDTFRPFLDFHEQLDRDGTLFDRYIFITSVDDDGNGTEDYRRLTAVVRWVPPDGFRREVVQTTLVAPFTEPSQPLIRADASWSGGTLDIRQRTDDLVYLGADDTLGTSDDVTLSATNVEGAVLFGADPLRLSVTFPSLETTAITDYVSSASARGDSMSISSLTTAGADGVFGTSDDPARVSVDPASVSFGADDDNLTSEPTSVGPTLSSGSVTAYRASGTRLVVADLNTSKPIHEVLGTESETLSWKSTVDVLYEDVAGDALPWGDVTFFGPDATAVGVYVDSSRSFGFFERSGDFAVSATADRDDTGGGVKDVFGGLEMLYVGTFSVLNDPYLADEDSDFEGWVRIDPPSGDSSGAKSALRVAGVGAGETGLYTTLVSGLDTTLTLQVWDVDLGDYSTVGVVDFTDAAPGCDDPVASTSGDVQQEEITKGFGTYEGLRYTVHVELDLRGFCEETTYDTASNISYRVWQTAGPMVSGDIDYVLEGYDLETDSYTTLMDFTMVLATDQIIIATAYIDPGAS